MLLSHDKTFLEEQYPGFSVSTENQMVCVVLPKFILPMGFNHSEVDLLLRLPLGYPDIAPDMWWFDPAVQRADKTEIQATNVYECYLGRNWQRWSRHLRPEQWQSNSDSIQSYVSVVKANLNLELSGSVT